VSTAAPTASANGGGTVSDPDSGGGSALAGHSSLPTACSSTVAGSGSGAGSSGVVSHATAQAQYLQAVMQQGALPFPFQATAHFGPGHQQVRNSDTSSAILIYDTHADW
jgi:hypothetical protein